MELRIKDTIKVKPSPQPFSEPHNLPLSHLDTDRNLHVIFRYLRVYTNTTTHTTANHPFQVITTSLSSALNHYYPLAGTLHRRHADNRLEVHCTNEDTLLVVHAVVNTTLKSLNYLDDAESGFTEKLVPDPSLVEGLTNPCMLQVTVFECGGFTLGVAIHHALADGIGATQFFNAMAELARGSATISIKPVWERLSLLGPRDPPRGDSVITKFLELKKGVEPYENAVGKVVREYFEVKDEWLDRLKKELLEKSGSSFTTFEALGAFIWRAKVKASGTGEEEEVKFAYSVNIRKTVNPALPRGYWGNACVPLYARLLAKDLIHQPIWKTAELIKQSKTNATDEYVRSFIDFQELHYKDGITAGNRVSGFTDWRHLGHSSVDFGWGGPVTVLPLSRNLVGSVEPCFFLPCSSATQGKKDGFKVLVTLQDTALPDFRNEMEKLKTKSEICSYLD